MNWIVFALAAWVAFGLEIGLRPLISPGDGSIAPSFVIPLLVYTSLWAPARTALWGALILGLGADLLSNIDLAPSGSATIIGPRAIGYLLAAVSFFTLRSFYDPIVWSPGHQLGVRFFSALYTGVSALAMALVLIPLSSAFQFPHAPGARFARRA